MGQLEMSNMNLSQIFISWNPQTKLINHYFESWKGQDKNKFYSAWCLNKEIITIGPRKIIIYSIDENLESLDFTDSWLLNKIPSSERIL